MSDSLAFGSKFRTLNILKDCNRETLVNSPFGVSKQELASIVFNQVSHCSSGFIEHFNGNYCREILNPYLFFELEEVHQLTEKWIKEYNTRRSNEALDNFTPREWLLKIRSENMENLSPQTPPTKQLYHIPTFK